MTTISCAVLDRTPCLCQTLEYHLALHPERVYARDYEPPIDVYEHSPEALDPDAGMPRAYHGPPAGMDRRHKDALGAPRPLCAPTDVSLPIDHFRPYAVREHVQHLDKMSLSGLAKCLYAVLASFYNWITRACFPARATILRSLVAAWGPVSDHAFRKALAELRRAGLISWDRGGTNHSNRYRFHLSERLVDLGLTTWGKIAALVTRGKAKSPSNSVVRRRVNLLSQIQRGIQGSPQSLLLGEMSGEAFDRRGWGTILGSARWLMDRVSAQFPTYTLDMTGEF